jgi:glycosyltransferase involved in cell wall biosynthesis
MKKENSVIRKTKVCIVAPSLDIYGGQARQAVRLREALSAEPTLEIDFIPHNPRLPEPLRFLQGLKYVRTVVTTFYYVLLLMARLWRYDIIHVFSAAYYSYMLSAVPALLLSKLYGKKVILNYRSGEADDHLARFKLTTKPIMAMADRLIVPSGYLVEVFAQFGIKAEYIYNIVELERFQFRDRAPLKPRFLCSRLLEPLYNVGNVLRAFHIVQQQYPAASMTIAADGFLRPELEQLARDLKLQNTEFLGFVPFDKMPALYDAHDIYLIGNDIDNMPAAVTESMACGISLVTTNAGGIPYLVKHEESALLVNCGDVQGLANNALRLLQDPALAARLAHNAREAARAFTWPAVRDEWLRVYQELMAAPLPQTKSSALNEQVNES